MWVLKHKVNIFSTFFFLIFFTWMSRNFQIFYLDRCCAKTQRYKTCCMLSSFLNSYSCLKTNISSTLPGHCEWLDVPFWMQLSSQTTATLNSHLTALVKIGVILTNYIKYRTAWNNFSNTHFSFYFAQTYPCFLPLHLEGCWRPHWNKW